MKHKFLVVLLAIVAVLCMAFGLTACEGVFGGTGLNFTLNKDKTEYSVTGLGKYKDKDVVIPSEYRGKPVTSIGETAFENRSGLTSVTIEEGVTSIGEEAFYGCSGLTSVTIPDSVTSIGAWAFYGCSGLTSVTIPDSVTSIGNGTFYDCSNMTSINIPNNVTSIGGVAFRCCSGLTSVNIGEGVTSIGDSAFCDCSNLTSINIPNNVTSIEDYAFSGCIWLTSVTLGRGVTSIGVDPFYGCYRLVEIWNYSGMQIQTGLGIGHYAKRVYTTDEKSKQIKTSDGYLFYEDVVESYLLGYSGTSTELTLPKKSLKENNYGVNQYAFYGCSGLTSVTIPSSVNSIGGYAFACCIGLTSIAIPNSVTSIGFWAFDGCENLKAVLFENPNWWKANEVSVSGLDDPATAAEKLTNTHCSSVWRRG